MCANQELRVARDVRLCGGFLSGTTGKESGMIAVETAGRSGRLFLDGEYRDLLTGRALCGNIELAPYEVLVLRE